MAQFIRFLWVLLVLILSLPSFAVEPLAEVDISHDNPDDTAESKPISFEFLYIADGVTGFSGPLDSLVRYVDDTLFNINMDNSKLFNLKGNSIFISFLGVTGGAPNLVVNSPQGIDNIESYYRTFRLYQAYMQQESADSKFSILAGLYDVNSEFYVTDSSLVFILPAFGTGTEFAQTGANGPSIFPTTSVATRIKIMPNENIYGMLGIMDGVSGNPDRQYGTQILMSQKDGLLLIGEIGTVFGGDKRQYKFALGAWDYTATTEQLVQAPVDELDPDATAPLIKGRDRGAYALFDIPLYRVSTESNRGLNFFLRPGVASPKINQFSPAVVAGFTVFAPFRNRDDDQAGIGVAYAKATADYITANSPISLLSETQYEITYAAQINKYIVIQPSLEYIHASNQSHEEPAEHNSVIGILRFKFSI